MKDKAQPSSLQRFRHKYSHIDYYPHRDSVVAIERLRAKCPKYTTRQILDVLIEAGEKSLFPEIKQGKGVVR